MEELPEIQEMCNVLGEQSFGFDEELSTKWADGPDGEKYYRERIAGEKGVCFVAQKDQEIVGFVSTTMNTPGTWRLTKRVEVDNLFIRESHRGEGVGKMLIDSVKDWSKSVGAKRVFLTAFKKNEKAISFYEREGFSPYELTLELRLGDD